MTTNMASSWDAYTNLAINAGAERCALFGIQPKGKWAGSGPNGGVTVIQDFDRLLTDVQAGQVTQALNFDGVKFMNTTVIEPRTSDQIHVGKAGEYACAVQRTVKALIIVITKGTPQSAVLQIAPVYSALMRAGF